MGVFDEDNELVWMEDGSTMRMMVSLDVSKSLDSIMMMPQVEFVTKHKNNVYWFSTIVPHNIGKGIQYIHHVIFSRKVYIVFRYS